TARRAHRGDPDARDVEITGWRENAGLTGDQALLDGESDEIRGAAGAQCVQEVRFVIFDRADRDAELRGDLLHALAPPDQAKHIELPRRQCGPGVAALAH